MKIPEIESIPKICVLGIPSEACSYVVSTMKMSYKKANGRFLLLMKLNFVILWLLDV